MLKTLIDSHRSITVLSHINPDADAIGTSLGVYALLKTYGKQVEIANFSTDLPKHLDFLPFFSKIKSRMDFDESLIISCDCGSIDRLGFDLSGRNIINIDHHQTNRHYGTLNLVDAHMAASSQVAYHEMKAFFPVDSDAATCFYAALLSDTQYFTTGNVTEEVFAFAGELLGHGARHVEVASRLTRHRSLASIRILGKALETLRLHCHAKVASLWANRGMIEATGAKMSDMDGIVDYARSLATVEIGIFLVEQGDHIKVSLRSKHRDVSPIAVAFGGGGHRNASGFVSRSGKIEEILDKILEKIDQLGYTSC